MSSRSKLNEILSAMKGIFFYFFFNMWTTRGNVLTKNGPSELGLQNTLLSLYSTDTRWGD